ncbi:MAG: S8 family serine peptidase [Candidatus Heimdallarchaeota archaeon]|nr:S8 family serine peptidase [Candidatus Heimdallarchaeota archaeon]
MKRTGIRISVVLLLAILTISTMNMVPALQDDKNTVEKEEGLVEEVSYLDDKAEGIKTNLIEEYEPENYLDNEFFEKYGISSGNKNIDFSTGLADKIASTPETLWSSTDVQLIVSFDKRSRLIDEKLTKFLPEILDTMPMAIINTNLAKINDIYNLRGVKGVYLNERYQIAEGWNSEEIDEESEFHTYPSEALIGARELLDLGIDGTGIKIAILDTGIDKYHPDLDDIDNNPYTYDPKVILEKSFIDYDGDGVADTDTSDGYGHGTHCAGIAAGKGILNGVAPNAWLMNGRVGDDGGQLEITWLLKAIDWAVLSGADIISMSLGWGIYNVMPLLDEAANYAWERGVILTVSAGNSGSNPRTTASPGQASRSITVGASTADNTITYWSSRGPSINGMIDPDVVAPGENILSMAPGNGYRVASGTSMSAPAVAGVAALLLSSSPDEDIGLIRSAIISTATDLGYHVFTQGAGLVNAKAAYDYLQNPSVYAYPGFSESSTLKLSQGEEIEYQFDIYLDDDYSSLSIEPATELTPYLTTEIIDPISQGWVRARLSIIMPNESLNSSLEIKDGSTVLYSLPLCLELDITQNDAETGTDAGELLTGAIPVTIGESFSGRVYEDGCDFYTFSVIKEHEYTVNITDVTDTLIVTLHDENGTGLDYAYASGSYASTKLSFVAISTGNYFINALNGYSYEHVNYTMGVYETGLSAGPQDKVYLTGNYADYAVDEDDNGLYERLEITVEVYANTPGDYDIIYYVNQKRMDYNFPKYIAYSRNLRVTLSEGMNELVLEVDGKTLEASDYNGNYILGRFSIGDPSTYTILFTKYNLFTTSIYRSNWFEKLDNRLLFYTFEDVNLDGTGKPEILKINAVFKFAEVGIHTISANFIDSSQYYYALSDYSEIEVTEAGIYTVSFSIFPQRFSIIKDIVLASFSGSIFDANIMIYDKISKNKLLSYDPIVSYSILDTAIDTDSNGKTDAIEFTFVVNSKIKADMQLWFETAVSLVNETYIPSDAMFHEQSISKGITIFKVYWDATKLRNLQFFAPLLFAELDIRFRNDDFNFYIEGYYVTNSYNYMDFEYPNARFTEFLGYEKFFTNDTCGYRLTFEITATKAVDIRLRAIIYGYESDNYFYDSIETQVTVVEGKNTVTIELDFTSFADEKYSGDLRVAYVYLYRTADDYLLDALYDVAIIEDTNYLDFINYFDAYFIDFQTEFLDNNTDGLYEGVSLHFAVNVTKIGTYESWFYTNDFLSYYSAYEDIEFNTTGVHNMTFYFSADFIGRELERSIVDGILRIERFTENYEWYYFYEFAVELNKEDFDYTLPIEFLSIEEDFAYDVNDDGLYDGISFTIEVNNTVAGYLVLELTLRTKIGEQILDNYISLEFWEESFPVGISNITFTIQASSLHYSYDLIQFYELEPIIEISIYRAISHDNVDRYFAHREILDFNNTYNLDEFDFRPAIEIIEVIIDVEEPSVGDYSQTILVTVSYQLNRIMDFEMELILRLIEEGYSYNPSHFVSMFFYPTEEGEFNYTFSIDISSIFIGIIPESIGVIVSSLYIKDLQNTIIIDSYGEYSYTFYSTYFGTETTEPTPTPTSTSSSPITLLIGGITSLAILIVRKRKRRI